MGLVSRSTLITEIRHLRVRVLYSLSSKTDHVWATIVERHDQSHLSHKLEVPKLTCLGREIEPGPPRWEANTLKKSYPNIVLIAIRNFYI
jgi:hypothetical protein